MSLSIYVYFIASTNLAYMKPSIQSGTDTYRWGSKKANDGDRDPDMHIGSVSCIQTESVIGPLWSVDLQENYSIEYIRFTNRRFDGMFVFNVRKYWGPFFCKFLTSQGGISRHMCRAGKAAFPI